MTDIERLRADHDRFCDAFASAFADAQRALRRLAAESGDDDPPPSRPGAARSYEPYPGRRMRRPERTGSRHGLEYADARPQLEYRVAGAVTWVR